MNHTPIRAFVTGLLVALLALAPNLAAAQSAPPPTEPEPSQSRSTTNLSDRELEMVRQAVQNVHDAYKRSRTSDGVGGIVGGLLIGGFGGYIYVAGDDIGDPTLQVIGIGLALSAVPQLVAGVWNIFYKTPQEEIANKLVDDDELLEGAGVLFVEQEARRAKRARLVGGSTSIVEGAAILGSYYLYSRVFGSVDILLIFFGVAAALQTIGGVITLVGLSGPEKAYRNLMQRLDGGGQPRPSDDNRISKMNVVPTILGNEGRVAPGVGLSLSF